MKLNEKIVIVTNKSNKIAEHIIQQLIGYLLNIWLGFRIQLKDWNGKEWTCIGRCTLRNAEFSESVFCRIFVAEHSANYTLEFFCIPQKSNKVKSSI